ncbi:hypothetical protein SLEP1_g41874 [Rubroshorea leprosula]|uniref:Uncharacterized protein n=1 Tax=Rubroshorea leprosula TaxID=152421 RepID=A0AAV5L7X6_9ROSI|nr:hypothetical protein SLEP1_g41874 [Rubroshorea leprosula]
MRPKNPVCGGGRMECQSVHHLPSYWSDDDKPSQHKSQTNQFPSGTTLNANENENQESSKTFLFTGAGRQGLSDFTTDTSLFFLFFSCVFVNK